MYGVRVKTLEIYDQKCTFRQVFTLTPQIRHGADLQSTSCTLPLRGQSLFVRLFKSVPYRFVDVRRTPAGCVHREGAHQI